MSQVPPQPPYQPQQPGYPPQQPPPPGYPPPQGFPPQQGHPPAGYPPQGGGYGAAYGMQPPRGGNGWGIASLITGIVGFCVPFAGGLLAMLFGAIGISKARKTGSGMALSVVGLILGLLSLGVYLLFGGAIWGMIQGTKVNRDVAKQFITDLNAGNVAAAQAKAGGSLSPGELQALSDELKGYGSITDITTVGFNVSNTNGLQQVVLGGAISFGANAHQFEMTQVKSGDQWLVSRFVVDGGAGRGGSSSTRGRSTTGASTPGGTGAGTGADSGTTPDDDPKDEK